MGLALTLLGVALALVGLAGLILPALPGLPFVLGGIVLVAWADGFARIGLPTLATVTVLAILGGLFDYAALLLGAKRMGASKWGLAGALLGLIVGLPLGFPGLIIGPGLGAMLLEYARDPDIRRSARAGAGVLVGFILGTAFRYAIAMTMIGIALLAYAF